jgi:hypothetical protein
VQLDLTPSGRQKDIAPDLLFFLFWYILSTMIVEQTVDVPPSRQLYINVPQEVPVGKTILTFTPAFAALAENLDHAEKIWAYNRSHPEELKVKLQELQGSLDKNAFDGLSGVEYQRKVRDEWDA